MPIYEYRCEACDHTFDKITKYEDKVQECAECGASSKRLISAGSFILRGGGWAKDGYGSNKRNQTPRPKSTPVNTSTLPWVGRDGSLNSADGKKILNADGSKV